MPQSEAQPLPNAPILQLSRIERGDPLPWIEFSLATRGRVNMEQFGGLKLALVFLASVGDPRTSATLSRLQSLYGPLPADVRHNQYVIVPVIARIDMAKDGDLLKEWMTVSSFIHDEDLAVHNAFGMAAGGRTAIAAILADEALTVRDVIHFTTPDEFAAAIVEGGAEPGAGCRPTAGSGNDRSGRLVAGRMPAVHQVLEAIDSDRERFHAEPGRRQAV